MYGWLWEGARFNGLALSEDKKEWHMISTTNDHCSLLVMAIEFKEVRIWVHAKF